jgi:hypothetical protein
MSGSVRFSYDPIQGYVAHYDPQTPEADGEWHYDVGFGLDVTRGTLVSGGEHAYFGAVEGFKASGTSCKRS